MKKILLRVLPLFLIFCLLCTMIAFADTGGNEGVRITVVRAGDHAVVTTPIDFTNKKPDNIQVHFGKVSKLQYNAGSGLTPTTSVYQYINPAQAMPRIISTNGGSNSAALFLISERWSL